MYATYFTKGRREINDDVLHTSILRYVIQQGILASNTKLDVIIQKNTKIKQYPLYLTFVYKLLDEYSPSSDSMESFLVNAALML